MYFTIYTRNNDITLLQTEGAPSDGFTIYGIPIKEHVEIIPNMDDYLFSNQTIKIQLDNLYIKNIISVSAARIKFPVEIHLKNCIYKSISGELQIVNR